MVRKFAAAYREEAREAGCNLDLSERIGVFHNVYVADSRERALDLARARAAEDAWNSRDPERVSFAYSPHSRWRNRSEFLAGREQIVAFLRRKWARELDYRLIKELWTFADNRIAVRFAYEWHDDS